ncbi:DUF421 domain-containing protein [Bacillota bacterium]
MFNVFIRTAILYMVALFVIRVMGKSELSKLDPFQLVALFMIAELASLPITSPNIAVLTGVAAMIGLLLIQTIVSVLSIKIPFFNDIVKGKATIVIDRGVINEKELKKYRMTIDDLSQQLRIKNCPSAADVQYAILEANGDMSVILKPEKNPVIREDLGIPTGSETLPMVLIADGILQKDNLERAGLDEGVLLHRLGADGIFGYEKVLMCFIDELGLIHYHLKNSAAGNSGVPVKETGSDLR